MTPSEGQRQAARSLAEQMAETVQRYDSELAGLFSVMAILAMRAGGELRIRKDEWWDALRHEAVIRQDPETLETVIRVRRR